MKSLLSFAGKDLQENGGRAIGIRTIAMGLVLFALCLSMVGCGPYAAPGETSAERALRHKRAVRINQGQFFSDLDRALMLDRPSGLAENRLP